MPVTLLGVATVDVKLAREGSVPHSNVTSVVVEETDRSPFNVA